MSDLRTAAQQALEVLESGLLVSHHAQVLINLRAALAEEALQRLSDANQEIEAALEQPEQDWSMLQATQESLREHMSEINRLRAALAQQEQEQEPVAWRYQNSLTDTEYLVWNKGTGGRNWTPLCTHPPRREQPKFTLSCGCPSQYGGVPAYWDRDGSTAFGMICERHWHEYGARSEA
jgi:hypothetical protein